MTYKDGWLAGTKLADRKAGTFEDLVNGGGKVAVTCEDGFGVSVIAHVGAYCNPRPGWGRVGYAYPGPFTEVEVGFPSERPEPWSKWEEYCENPEDPTGTVYAYVPVGLVRELIALHGGEV